MESDFPHRVRDIITCVRLGNDRIGTEHLPMSLLRDTKNIATQIIQQSYSIISRLRKDVSQPSPQQEYVPRDNNRGTAVKSRCSIHQTLTETIMSVVTEERTSPVLLSPQATEEVKKILASEPIPEEYGLRVGVRGGGCSGMSYILGFDKQREHDLTFDYQGITLYIDKRHGLYLMGTTIDYHIGLDARGFTFNNPNATQTCGCGSSFAA